MAASRKNELRVGIFILIPLAILLLIIMLKLGYSIASSTIDVYLKIDNLTSVKKGTAIKLKGYTIGRVVELIPGHEPAIHFLATMRIDKSIQLNENCSAVIMNQNVIGDPVISIKNPEKKGPPLRNHDVIEGIEYVNLEAILQDAHLLLSNVSGTVKVLKEISLDSRSNIRLLLSNLSASVKRLNRILEDSEKDIVVLMASFRETAQNLNVISREFKKHPMKFLWSGKKGKKK